MNFYNHDPKKECFLTFAVSIRTPQYSALLDHSIRLKKAVHILLCLLLVQHANKQLPVLCNTTQ